MSVQKNPTNWMQQSSSTVQSTFICRFFLKSLAEALKRLACKNDSDYLQLCRLTHHSDDQQDDDY